MGLSRNKVAVSEGAAGSPPFYGERPVQSRHSAVWRILREILLFNFRRPMSKAQLVSLTQRVHPFPFRTRKLSSAVPTILHRRRCGKIGRSQHRGKPSGSSADLGKRDHLSQGGVAQLGEHLLCKQGVMGSSPIISTKVVGRCEPTGIGS